LKLRHKVNCVAVQEAHGNLWDADHYRHILRRSHSLFFVPGSVSAGGLVFAVKKGFLALFPSVSVRTIVPGRIALLDLSNPSLGRVIFVNVHLIPNLSTKNTRSHFGSSHFGSRVALFNNF
jgi:hypothetical protein